METKVEHFDILSLDLADSVISRMSREGWRVLTCVSLPGSGTHLPTVVWTLVRDQPSDVLHLTKVGTGA